MNMDDGETLHYTLVLQDLKESLYVEVYKAW